MEVGQAFYCGLINRVVLLHLVIINIVGPLEMIKSFNGRS